MNFKYLKKATIIIIFLLAAFFKLYKINQYMTFLGDEGRDALVVRGILISHHFPLLGPVTSIGNMYLGPLYYYMMAVSMAIIWLNPVGAAIMVAFVSLLALGLIFYLSNKWFGFFPASIAAFLYAISPVVIYYSRSSWNPNPAPFFAVLGIFSLYKLHQSHNFYWFILSNIALAFAVQMHYLALLLMPVFYLLWLVEVISQKKIHQKGKYILSGTVLGIGSFLLLMSPLAIFDLRHNFMNTKAIIAFFSQRQTTVNLNPFNSLSRIPHVYIWNLLERYIGGDNNIIAYILSLIVIIPLLKWLISKKKEWIYLCLGIWLIIGLLGLSLYKQTIYDHYLGFLSPVPYLLLAAFASLLNKRWQKVSFSLFIVVVAYFNLIKNPLLLPPNNELQRTQEVDKFIISLSGNKPFNFALLAKNNYDAAYKYYLEVYSHPPAMLPFKKTDQLFVVCEDKNCQPIGNPKYEIAAFGWAKEVKMWQILGVKVYKLVPNTPRHV